MSSETNYSFQQLGALVDETTEQSIIDWIQSVAKNTLIRRANVAGPENNVRMKNLANQLITGAIDVIVFLTNSGVYQFFRRSDSVDPVRLRNAVSDISTVVIGKAAIEAMLVYGVKPTIKSEELSGWREVLIHMESAFELPNLQIGLEKTTEIYGLSAGLEARGANVNWIEIDDFQNTDASAEEQDILDAIEDSKFGCLFVANPICAARFAHLVGHRRREVMEQKMGGLKLVAADRETKLVLANAGIISSIMDSKLPNQ